MSTSTHHNTSAHFYQNTSMNSNNVPPDININAQPCTIHTKHMSVECHACREFLFKTIYKDVCHIERSYLAIKKTLTKPCMLWMNLTQIEGVTTMNLTPWTALKCITKEDAFKIEIQNILSAQYLYIFIDEYQEYRMKNINAKGSSPVDLSRLEFKIFDAKSVIMPSDFLDFFFDIPLTEE